MIEPSAVSPRATIRFPWARVRISSDMRSPIPVSEATPTTTPAAAHAAAEEPAEIDVASGFACGFRLFEDLGR